MSKIKPYFTAEQKETDTNVSSNILSPKSLPQALIDQQIADASPKITPPVVKIPTELDAVDSSARGNETLNKLNNETSKTAQLGLGLQVLNVKGLLDSDIGKAVTEKAGTVGDIIKAVDGIFYDRPESLIDIGVGRGAGQIIKSLTPIVIRGGVAVSTLGAIL